MDLRNLGINVAEILRNMPPGRLYERAVLDGDGQIVQGGALAVSSGAKTGRSPRDKRIVEAQEIAEDVWWGDVNIRLDAQSHLANRRRAIDFFNRAPRLYVTDGFAGWDPAYAVKIRVVSARPYHALFMHNMLVRPTAEQLAHFDEPDYIIFNAGSAHADAETAGLTSTTSISLDLDHGEIVILGTDYAGEMKKGVFTVMHYLMPKREVLSMHCSANEGTLGDVTLLFGLSGTGKTTLSADPKRRLIGDDEHCWTDQGIFNIEGGCYAKCIHLSAASEPEIFAAVRFGAVLENVVYDPVTRIVDFGSDARTENTRVAYPIEFIPNAKIPCVGGHPRNIIFLTCDAFGVLPPVSRLSSAQAMYHFLSGYTAKVAGTEMGITEPTATFSACFGAAFLIWHPTRYAELLAEKIDRHHAQAWLVNTGWIGGAYGTGSRITLRHTRAIIDAIHSGALLKADSREDSIFGLAAPTTCPGVPGSVLSQRELWRDAGEYQRTAEKLAHLFHKNFAQYAALASPETAAAGPRIGQLAARRQPAQGA